MPELSGEIGELVKDMDEKMGGVMLLGSQVPTFTHIPTGTFLLDYAMVGGYAEGCGHMIYGNPSCGKTTLCKLVAAAVQRKYPRDMVAWIDTEKKFDPVWAERLGVDLDRIMVIKPRTGEQAVDIIEAMARTMEVRAVFLDSIPSLAPIKIIEKSAEDTTVAARARLVGLLCSKLQQAWIDEGQRGHKFTFFAINQFRVNVGQRFGDTRKLPGGRFQEYMVDTKLDLKSKESMNSLEGQERHTINTHNFKFTKTKGAFSIKSGEFTMVMDTTCRPDEMVTGQCDDYKTVATFAKRRGLITGGGSHWKIQGALKENGKPVQFAKLDAIVEYFKVNPEHYKRIMRVLIMAQRADSKVPVLPKDNYLYGAVTRAERAALMGGLEVMGYGRE